MRTSTGSSGSGSVRLLEHSVAPNDVTWIAVGSRASRSRERLRRSRCSGRSAGASRSAIAKRGWSSICEPDRLEGRIREVHRSSTSVSSATDRRRSGRRGRRSRPDQRQPTSGTIPPMWNSGSGSQKRSSGVAGSLPRATSSPCRTIDSCVSRQPFGCEVVPDVYISSRDVADADPCLQRPAPRRGRRPRRPRERRPRQEAVAVRQPRSTTCRRRGAPSTDSAPRVLAGDVREQLGDHRREVDAARRARRRRRAPRMSAWATTCRSSST